MYTATVHMVFTVLLMHTAAALQMYTAAALQMYTTALQSHANSMYTTTAAQDNMQ